VGSRITYRGLVTKPVASRSQPGARLFGAIDQVLGAPPWAVDEVSDAVAERLFEALYRASAQSPPAVQPGRLRPLSPRTYEDQLAIRSRTLRLLLYAHEVVTPLPFPGSAGSMGEAGMSAVHELERLRPLIEDGSLIVWEPLGSTTASLPVDERNQFDEDVWQVWSGEPPTSMPSTMDDHLEAVQRWGTRDTQREEYVIWHSQLIRLIDWPSHLTPWFASEAQRSAAERVLGQVFPAISRPALRLPRLASLELPRLELRIPDLVAVRRNGAAFAEFRQELTRALTEVELLPDDDAWTADARALIADEMTPYTDRLRREVENSSALSAAVTGVRTLTIAGIGSATGTVAVSTSPQAGLAALTGVASAALISGLSDWAKARRDAVPKRAVLQLAMMFSDDEP